MTEATFKTAMQRAHRRHVQSYAAAAVIIDLIGAALLERLSFIKLQPRRILDLGSGLATLSRALHQRFPEAEVLAVDFTQTMSCQAAENCRAFPAIRIITADAYHLPLPANSIDLLCANLLLPALLDYPALWHECRRVLVPGGLLMFSNLGPDTLRELKQSLASIDDYPHVNSFIDMHDVGDGLVEARFSDPVLDVEHFCLSYPSLSALLHELQALGSIKFIEGSPRHLGKRAWHQVEQYYRRHFSDDNRLLVDVEAYFGHAFKPLQETQRREADGSVTIGLDLIKRPSSL